MVRSPTQFVLPDLVAQCPYPLHLNPHTAKVAPASEAWILQNAPFTEEKRAAFLGLIAGDLAGAAYPDAPPDRLRVISDFLNFLFTLDDWSDEFTPEDTVGLGECVMRALRDPQFHTSKAAGKLAQSLRTRLGADAGPRCTRRFMDTMDLFFHALRQQASDRAAGAIPTLEEYIALRWDTSACKPCFALIEYAAGIDLPDEVAEDPAIVALNEATNALITWSNDIFSYNVEQARGDTHNMIAVAMREDDLTLQEAIDYAGRLCAASLERFEDIVAVLPSWDLDTDAAVDAYIDGLENWIVGSLHWSFATTRYFGRDGPAVMTRRVIDLLPAPPEKVAGQKPAGQASDARPIAQKRWFATMTAPRGARCGARFHVRDVTPGCRIRW